MLVDFPPYSPPLIDMIATWWVTNNLRVDIWILATRKRNRVRTLIGRKSSVQRYLVGTDPSIRKCLTNNNESGEEEKTVLCRQVLLDRLTLSLPRVSNFKLFLQPYLASQFLLRWKIIIATNLDATSLMHFLCWENARENVLFWLRIEWVNMSRWMRCKLGNPIRLPF